MAPVRRRSLHRRQAVVREREPPHPDRHERAVEADALLDELFAHQDANPARYRHRWSTGDLVMWDNRCLNHRAVGGVVPLPHIRRLQRTTITGSASA